MISNPINITATKSTSASVAKATSEYLNDESVENELARFEQSIANKIDYQDYLQSENTKLHFVGLYAIEHNIDNNEMNYKITKDFIEGKSLDGKHQVRHKKNKEGKVVYNYNLDMVYSSNKYLNTSLAVGNDKMKSIMQRVHNKGSNTAIAELEKLAVVKIKGKYQKILLPIAQVQHNKSRANEQNTHKHLWINLFGKCKDGKYRVADEKPFKNASNRLYIDMIAKNAEMNALIEEGVKVSPMTDKTSSLTDNLDRSFYAIDGVENASNLFNTEEKLILTEYKKLMSSHKKEIAPLIVKQQNNTIIKEEAERLSKLRFEIKPENATYVKQNIAIKERGEKTELPIDVIRQKQTDKVFTNDKNFNQSFLHENPELQKAQYKLNEPLTDLEIKAVMDKVLDKKVRTSELEIKAYVVDAFKGRFSNEELHKQYLSIRKEYLIEPKMIEGVEQFTTKEKLFSEIHFKRIIKDLVKPTNKAILNDLEAEKTIKDINDSRKANNQPLLNKDQQKAVYKGLTSKSNAFLISAFAGTGKTTATLKPIVDNFVKATKGNVYTATVANLPANILKEEVNADTAYNTTTLINGLKSGKIQLTKNDLVILDEVSMIGLKDNLTICDEIVKSKARIVFVGDYEQLHSITSQSSMRILLDTLQQDNVGNLSQVVRQKDKEQANTVELISKGDIDNALISIEKNKQANFFDSQIDCMASLSNDFINLTLNHPEQKTTAYAYRIDDIIEMNNLIADGLKNNNLIDKNVFKAVYETTKDDFGSSKKYDIELYKKETVIFKETFYDKDKNKIANGQQGQIVDINGSVLSIKLADSDKVVDVDTRKYQKLLPSMCMSIYASQGATTGNSLVLADETYNRKLALIGISRGQLKNNIYVNGDKETLEDILNKVVEKENLLDTATTEEIQHYEKIYENAKNSTIKTDFKSILSKIDIEAVNKNINDSILDKVKKTAIELKDKVVAVDYIGAVNDFTEQLKEDIKTVKQFKNNVVEKIETAKEIALTPLYALDTYIGKQIKIEKNKEIINQIKTNDENVKNLTYAETFGNPDIVKVIDEDNYYKSFNFEKMAKQMDMNKNFYDLPKDDLIRFISYANKQYDNDYAKTLDEDKKRVVKYINEYTSLSNEDKKEHKIHKAFTDLRKVGAIAKAELFAEKEIIKAKEKEKEDFIDNSVELLTNKNSAENESVFTNNFNNIASKTDNKTIEQIMIKVVENAFKDNKEKLLKTALNSADKSGMNASKIIEKMIIETDIRNHKTANELDAIHKMGASIREKASLEAQQKEAMKPRPTIKKGPSLGLSM